MRLCLVYCELGSDGGSGSEVSLESIVGYVVERQTISTRKD